jgi:hypothetical protein
MYNIKTHGDFKKYFDKNYKRNYWVLGYFGGGSINIVEAYELAKQMATALNVPIETIQIDEILHSSRHKSFKYMYSMVSNQQPEKDIQPGYMMDNVFEWLTR